MFHAFFRELRRTLRVITKTPVLSTIAVLSLALGVAVNATIWSVVHAFLLRPLPYPEADRIVMFWQNPTAQAQDDQAVAPANYFDWKESAESFSMIGAADFGSVNLTGIDQPEQLTISYIAPELLADLEPVPLEGRLFLPDEGGEGNRPVLLSNTLWRQRFTEAPDIVGQEITLDGARHTVVGVLPDSFDHLLGHVELWMAHDFRDQRDDRESTDLLVTGRLAPGVSRAQAQEEMGA
ncbi:MAG: ABC transporter permease, partial [Holophagales bacterium]|nr:ABC transporter permease [Holophagales bacterium]